MSFAILVLGLVTLQRLRELVIARRDSRRFLARGAVEVADRHYGLIVALHAAWITGLWLLAWDNPVNKAWLALFIVLQLVRVWVLRTLGERWTTRIIVLPGEPLVRRGPYRLLSHPNYAVVIAEIAVLPLAFGLPVYALVFSIFNAAVLSIRIRAEADALKQVAPA